MSDLTLDDYFTLLKSGNVDERRNAAWYLGRQRDDRIITALIDALNDDDDDVRLRVVEALGNLRNDQVVMPLVGALAEQNPKIRAQVVVSLGKQGDFRAFQAILDLLKEDDATIRVNAAQALNNLPDARAIPPLVTMMLNDEDDDARYFAFQTLKTIGGDATVDALLLALLGEPEAGSLISILEIFAALKATRAIDAVEKLTDHADDGVSATAKWALTQIPAED